MVIPRTTKTVEALQLAHDSGVITSMPGHTTHRVRPMDVAFFRPLSSCYIEKVENWLRANPRRCRSSESGSDFWLWVRKSSYCGHSNQHLQAYRIWPVNRYAFQDHNFFPSVTNTSGAAFVQPVQGVTRWCGSKSSLQETEIHICLFPWRKYYFSQKLILLAVLKNRTGPKCLRRRQN